MPSSRDAGSHEVAPAPRLSLTARNELCGGAALLFMVVVFGTIVAGDHGPTVLDRWGMVLVSHLHGGPWAELSRVSSPVVVGAFVSLCAGCALLRKGWHQVITCLAAPVATVLVVQLLKSAFGRLDAGVSSYPSGSVAVVASIAAVGVMVAGVRWWRATCVLATAMVLAEGVAVVALRWHYPTDAFGGAAVGVAMVLVVDGVARSTRQLS